MNAQDLQDTTPRSESDLASAVHQRRYRDVVAPLLARACSSCHGADEPEAGVVVAALDGSMDESGQVAMWKKIRRMVDTRTMPPKDADPLSAEEVAAILSEIDEGQRLQRERLRATTARHVPRRLTGREKVISRKAFLVGSGATLALPFFASLVKLAVAAPGRPVF